MQHTNAALLSFIYVKGSKAGKELPILSLEL